MSLILLPDVCEMPNIGGGGKRKRREGEGGVSCGRTSPMKMGRAASFFSESSGGSSRSRASMQSATSSRCSFPAVACEEEDEDLLGESNDGRVRIAIGGM